MHTMNSARTAVLAAACLVALSAQSATAADVALFKQWRTRAVDSSGAVLGYVANISHRQGQSPASPIAATRPNGQQTWSSSSDSELQASFALTSSVSAMNTWCEDNFKGVWQYGQGGTATRTFDTTPYYAMQASQEYVSLTADSINLFNTIRSQGLTGTFTFNLTQQAPNSYYTNPDFSMVGHSCKALIAGETGAPYEILEITGSSFTVDITSALGANAMMIIDNNLQWQYLSIETSHTVLFQNRSIFGLPSAIPAPGAIALLGLAGLTGRRRR